MNFLICFNEAYSRQGLTLMVSIIKNNPNAEIHFFILTDKLSESTSRKIMEFSRAKVVIEIYTVNIEEISTFRTGRHFNKYIFLRLLFPKIPQIANIDRLIYLDSDMICVGTLDALFSQKQNLEKTIGAVEEPYSDIIAIQKEKLHITRYFNSGFLLIQPRLWIDHTITERVLTYIQQHSDLLEFPDQDALNVILVDEVEFISRKYNTMHSEFVDVSMEPVKLIHFAGDIKPWKPYYFHNGGSIYLKYYIHATKNYWYYSYYCTQFFSRIIMKNPYIFRTIRKIFAPYKSL